MGSLLEDAAPAPVQPPQSDTGMAAAMAARVNQLLDADAGLRATGQVFHKGRRAASRP